MTAPTQEVLSTRLFDTPRDRLVRAFTDPAQLARWWGPAGFTNTFREFDPRPGGRWRFVMHEPDGQHFDITKEFLEFTPPDRITLRHVQPTHGFQMTMTYTDAPPSQTRLTWHMRFDSPQPPETIAYITQANEQNFDRLAAHLATIP